MKQLIVHMDDRSTDFLSDIYKDIRGCTVVRHTTPARELNKLIESHDRVVMLGHGSPGGLFDREGGFVIGDDNVEALKGKENIYIWCHASMFVRDKGLKGFSTGMFISEVSEARYCGVSTMDDAQEEIAESNRSFAELVRSRITEPTSMIYECAFNNYTTSGMYDSEVIRYNHCRLELFT